MALIHIRIKFEYGIGCVKCAMGSLICNTGSIRPNRVVVKDIPRKTTTCALCIPVDIWKIFHISPYKKAKHGNSLQVSHSLTTSVCIMENKKIEFFLNINICHVYPENQFFARIF